jgi:polyhydroxyalkanoate synthesis regulator phasin
MVYDETAGDMYVGIFTREGLAPLYVAFTVANLGYGYNLNNYTDEEMKNYINSIVADLGLEEGKYKSEVVTSAGGNKYVAIEDDESRMISIIYDDINMTVYQMNMNEETYEFIPLTQADKDFAVDVFQGIWTTHLLGEEKYPDVGISFVYPEIFGDVKGVFSEAAYGLISKEPKAYYLGFIYAGMPQREYMVDMEKVVADKLSEEELNAFIDKLDVMACVIVTDGDLEQVLKTLEYENAETFELGTVDAYHYYLVTEQSDAILAKLDAQYAEEYTKLKDALVKAVKEAKLFAPVEAAK